ncbi:ABC transporter permease [Paenibacillus aestuarii]|uniref:ABC transporter permease n=1 Tax=Paenibacillus aestuarii TaxID=516965 RepID=A0ABW0KAN1_9BACL
MPTDLARAKSQKPASLIWHRIHKNKTAMIGCILLLIVIFAVVFAPFLASYPVDKMNFKDRFQGPSLKHFFGTDDFGRDIFARVLFGGRISLVTGLVTVAVSSIFGVMIGTITGYYRKIDLYVMLVMDTLLALPPLILAIAIIAIFGPGLTNAMMAIVIAIIPRFVRLVRSSVLSVREKEYIEAVHALGVPDYKILLKHIIPNIISPIIVLTTILFGNVILVSASLSFLGLGAQPPAPEWGAMVNVGKSYLTQAWWMSLFPGLGIMLAVLGFNLLGDGLRDVLDPKMNK